MPGDIILLYIHVYHKWRSYDIWFLKYKVWQTEIFVILGHFLPFQPLENPEKLKKTPGDIIILHICTINDNHMMYDSWDMEHCRHNFCHSGPFFALLHPLWTKKTKIRKKNKKKTLEDIIILQMCTINDSHMIYGFWGMECNGQNFLSLCFLPFYPPPP